MKIAPRLLLSVWVCGLALCDARSEPKAIARAEVESSSIASAGYNRRSKLLEIEFHSGAIYRYRDVPKKVFTAFSASQSKGHFFTAEIRGKYTYDKVRGPKE